MKIKVLAALAAAALAFSGCSSNSGSGEKSPEVRVWLVGTDTPSNAREYLKKTFEEKHPEAKLVFEDQAWEGLMDKLTTNLSGSDAPDVVEMGNTQAPAFTAAGAFYDLSGHYEELGGKDLLPDFVEIGSHDGKLYAPPYFASARLVFYRKDLYAAAGLSVPKTFDEFVANGKALTQQNQGVSGIYLPGKATFNALPFIWENGGEIATQQDDGNWDAQLSSPASVAGLKQLQDVMRTASLAPKDGAEADGLTSFCAGAVGQVSAGPWFKDAIMAPPDADTPGCPELADSLGMFALPGKAGGPGQVFSGGSNIAVPARAKNPELGVEVLKIMLSDEYQTMLGERSFLPARLSLADSLGTEELAKVSAEAMQNLRVTPASPRWADVEAEGILDDMFVKIGMGEDVEQLAAEADQKIEAVLNS